MNKNNGNVQFPAVFVYADEKNTLYYMKFNNNDELHQVSISKLGCIKGVPGTYQIAKPHILDGYKIYSTDPHLIDDQNGRLILHTEHRLMSVITQMQLMAHLSSCRNSMEDAITEMSLRQCGFLEKLASYNDGVIKRLDSAIARLPEQETAFGKLTTFCVHYTYICALFYGVLMVHKLFCGFTNWLIG